MTLALFFLLRSPTPPHSAVKLALHNGDAVCDCCLGGGINCNQAIKWCKGLHYSLFSWCARNSFVWGVNWLYHFSFFSHHLEDIQGNKYFPPPVFSFSNEMGFFSHLQMHKSCPSKAASAHLLAVQTCQFVMTCSGGSCAGQRCREAEILLCLQAHKASAPTMICIWPQHTFPLEKLQLLLCVSGYCYSKAIAFFVCFYLIVFVMHWPTRCCRW